MLKPGNMIKETIKLCFSSGKGVKALRGTELSKILNLAEMLASVRKDASMQTPMHGTSGGNLVFTGTFVTSSRPSC